ncbi:MAG: methyltransferase domain-containing protein [Candidatus Absconditabacterales bacterium]
MFNSNYSKKNLFWGEKPNRLLNNITEFKKNSKVLDLGTGEGKDSIYLAKLGFDVTGVDISRPGIDKLNNIIKQNKLNVKTIVEDIRNFEFNETYDIVLCFTVLQLLNLYEINEMIKKIQDHTNTSGINIITSFTKNNPNKQCPYTNKDGTYQQYYLFDNNELKNYYEKDKWKILHYDEYETPYHKHGDIEEEHKHEMVAIIAKKT